MRPELTLIEWLQERFNNTQRLAKTKNGVDRAGWIEDGEFLAQAIGAAIERDKLKAELAATREQAYQQSLQATTYAKDMDALQSGLSARILLLEQQLAEARQQK